uniref:homeobox protein ANF-1-like n=1 Tax=Podarcis muralis TaxID=64176 RepID=UPI00109FE17E|nr:homeobox protein ANF-1-like [Podarcis muralis]
MATMMATNNKGGSYPKVGGDRRKRTVFTPAQIELLKKEFEENQYPGYQTREALARCIRVEEDRVHDLVSEQKSENKGDWFQNNDQDPSYSSL